MDSITAVCIIASCFSAAGLGIAGVRLSRALAERDKLAASVTRLAAANEELKRLALYDWLTGLPNRLLLEDRLRQAIAKAEREETGFMVLFLDLDGFKLVNDELGHSAGDFLLNQIARRLSQNLRHQDTIARMGGDEFVIVAEIDSAPGVAVIRDKVLDCFSAPFPLGDRLMAVKASVGHARYPEDGDSMEELLAKADDAMYHLKNGGRQVDQLVF